MATLDEKIALITGFGSGISRAVALAFAKEGAHVTINYPDKAQEQQAHEVKKAVLNDIAPTYVFLASDKAIHYVGQCLSPNGGDMML